MVFGFYLLGEGTEAILNAGARARDRRGDACGRARSCSRNFPAPLGHARRHHDAQHGGLPRPDQRRDGRQGHGRAQRLRDLAICAAATSEGELFLMSDGVGVGYGARPFADGNDAVYLVAQENYPAEFLDIGLSRARAHATPSIPIPAAPAAGAAAAA